MSKTYPQEVLDAVNAAVAPIQEPAKPPLTIEDRTAHSILDAWYEAYEQRNVKGMINPGLPIHAQDEKGVDMRLPVWVDNEIFKFAQSIGIDYRRVRSLASQYMRGDVFEGQGKGPEVIFVVGGDANYHEQNGFVLCLRMLGMRPAEGLRAHMSLLLNWIDAAKVRDRQIV